MAGMNRVDGGAAVSLSQKDTQQNALSDAAARRRTSGCADGCSPEPTGAGHDRYAKRGQPYAAIG